MIPKKQVIKMIECLIVGIGGFAGSILRYLIGLIPVRETWIFPVKTFGINVAGAFIIGVIAGAVLKKGDLDPRLVLLVKVGICGGFTTFSSFALETFDLIKAGNVLTALAYGVFSVAAGIAAVFAGEWAVTSISR